MPGRPLFNSGSFASPQGGGADDKRRVLDATDLVRLVSEHVALKQKGREYVCLCPFHDDHNPSMCVVPAKQIFKCFVCGAGGDAITFIREFHKMSFREALEHLAERAGITLTPWRPQRSGGGAGFEGGETGSVDRAALLRANQSATSFFRAILSHPEHGAAARAIVARRGISPEMSETFAVGAAPDRWDGLRATVLAKDLELRPFLAAGLLKPRDSGGEFDMFRNRLMFPIHDLLGRVVAFGGRRINDEDEPKYINSSEHAAFEKSATLYGLHQGSQAIRQTRTCVVVEGYMDVIACHQAGFKNVVATLGTALTARHASVLRRLAETVVLLFDGDEAGQKAADRAVEVFFDQSIDLRVATLASATDAKDADELLKREGGDEVFRQVLASAIDPLELIFRRVRASVEGKGVAARARVFDEFLGRITTLGLSRVDRLRYQLIVTRLAEIAGVPWKDVADALAEKTGRRPQRSASGSAVSEPTASHRPAAERLLGCLLRDPDLLATITADDQHLLGVDAFESEAAKLLAGVITDIEADGEAPDLRTVLGRSDDPEVQRLATTLEAEVERQTEGKQDRLRQHWQSTLQEARRAEAAASIESKPTAAPASLEKPNERMTMDAALRAAQTRLDHKRRMLKEFGDDQRAISPPASRTG